MSELQPHRRWAVTRVYIFVAAILVATAGMYWSAERGISPRVSPHLPFLLIVVLLFLADRWPARSGRADNQTLMFSEVPIGLCLVAAAPLETIVAWSIVSALVRLTARVRSAHFKVAFNVAQDA